MRHWGESLPSGGPSGGKCKNPTSARGMLPSARAVRSTVPALARAMSSQAMPPPTPTSGCGPKCTYATYDPLALVYDIEHPEHAAPFVDKFYRLDKDADTASFLESCGEDGVITSLVSTPMRLFLSNTDTNAILKRSQMFVLSQAQVLKLLGWDSDPDAGRAAERGRLLDIGAGDGNVTSQLAPLFEVVETTEVSRHMARRLRERGWRCVETTVPGSPDFEPGSYDVVSCFNVLDRCDDPLGVLGSIRTLLKPEGKALLSVVLPYGDFVEGAAGRNRAPQEPLPMGGGYCRDGASWEQATAVLADRILPSAGFEVDSVSRVPYLCRGDSNQPYYVLHDAVFVLRPAADE